MNRRVAFPFLTLSDEALSAGKWEVQLNNDPPKPAADFLADWDPGSLIGLSRTVELDPEQAARDLEMEQDGLEFVLNVRVGTGQGQLPRLILRRESHRLDDGNVVCQLGFSIPGDMLSSVLDVRTDVLLAVPVASGSPLSPQKAGDRIWSDEIRIRLEGEEPRFPIETADFAALLGGVAQATAPWHVHWSPHDWDRDFHGSIRLYLNQDHPEFIERVEQQDGLTLQAMLADVMGQVCEKYVLDAESEDFGEFEPGTLGAQAKAWLSKAWPSQDLSVVRSVLTDRPGNFRTGLLALARLGDS